MQESVYEKREVLFAGCGFLSSYIVPNIIPFMRAAVLLDRDRVIPENYENGLFLKGYRGNHKVTAFATLIQSLANVPVVPLHLSLQKGTDILFGSGKNDFDIDFVFVTFDNLAARMYIRDQLDDQNIPALSVGVTENYARIEWNENLEYHKFSNKYISKIIASVQRVEDVCSRIEFRTLGTIAASLSSHAFYIWLTTKQKISFQVSLVNGVPHVSSSEV